MFNFFDPSESLRCVGICYGHTGLVSALCFNKVSTPTTNPSIQNELLKIDNKMSIIFLYETPVFYMLNKTVFYRWNRQIFKM